VQGRFGRLRMSREGSLSAGIDLVTFKHLQSAPWYFVKIISSPKKIAKFKNEE
jgi:hypothetical protein